MGLQNLVDNLLLAQHGRTAKEELTELSFDRWDHCFIFEALQNQRYGQSFCNHFGITDHILFYERDPERAREYIKNHYL